MQKKTPSTTYLLPTHPGLQEAVRGAVELRPAARPHRSRQYRDQLTSVLEGQVRTGAWRPRS